MNQQNNQAFWQLDTSKAEKVGQSNFIQGNSAELYKILSAAWVTNTNASPAIYQLKLHVMNANKSTAHIEIAYGTESGDRWSGENIINALMLCANVSSLTQSQGQYYVFDFDSKKDLVNNGLVAPELAGKKVGLFLADNYYVSKQTGEVKRGGLNIYNVYDADTKQLPKEKARNQPANPETFDEMFAATLESSAYSEKKAKEKAGMVETNAPTGFNNQMANGGAPANQGVTYAKTAAPVNQPDVSDDDIPF